LPVSHSTVDKVISAPKKWVESDEYSQDMKLAFHQLRKLPSRPQFWSWQRPFCSAHVPTQIPRKRMILISSAPPAEPTAPAPQQAV